MEFRMYEMRWFVFMKFAVIVIYELITSGNRIIDKVQYFSYTGTFFENIVGSKPDGSIKL